jgi:hypothetical protein
MNYYNDKNYIKAAVLLLIRRLKDSNAIIKNVIIYRQQCILMLRIIAMQLYCFEKLENLQRQ